MIPPDLYHRHHSTNHLHQSASQHCGHLSFTHQGTNCYHQRAANLTSSYSVAVTIYREEISNWCLTDDHDRHWAARKVFRRLPTWTVVNTFCRPAVRTASSSPPPSLCEEMATQHLADCCFLTANWSTDPSRIRTRTWSSLRSSAISCCSESGKVLTRVVGNRPGVAGLREQGRGLCPVLPYSGGPLVVDSGRGGRRGGRHLVACSSSPSVVRSAVLLGVAPAEARATGVLSQHRTDAEDNDRLTSSFLEDELHYWCLWVRNKNNIRFDPIVAHDP